MNKNDRKLTYLSKSEMRKVTGGYACIRGYGDCLRYIGSAEEEAALAAGLLCGGCFYVKNPPKNGGGGGGPIDHELAL